MWSLGESHLNQKNSENLWIQIPPARFSKDAAKRRFESRNRLERLRKQENPSKTDQNFEQKSSSPQILKPPNPPKPQMKPSQDLSKSETVN